MSAHTPGPWSIFTDTHGLRSVKGPADGGERCWVVNIDRQTSEADAALIARAPDLLAEVAALRAELERTKEENSRLGTRVGNIGDDLREALGRSRTDYTFRPIDAVIALRADRDALRLRVEALAGLVHESLPALEVDRERLRDACDHTDGGECVCDEFARRATLVEKARAALEWKP